MLGCQSVRCQRLYLSTVDTITCATTYPYGEMSLYERVVAQIVAPELSLYLLLNAYLLLVPNAWLSTIYLDLVLVFN